jgi:hypothetical protein
MSGTTDTSMGHDFDELSPGRLFRHGRLNDPMTGVSISLICSADEQSVVMARDRTGGDPVQTGLPRLEGVRIGAGAPASLGHKSPRKAAVDHNHCRLSAFDAALRPDKPSVEFRGALAVTAYRQRSAGHRAAVRQFDCADPAGHTGVPSFRRVRRSMTWRHAGGGVEQWLTSIVVGSCVGPLLAPLPWQC